MKYELGNALRGFAYGEFESIDEAWTILSNRFLLSYPNKTGRTVLMSVQEENKYGFTEYIKCKDGITDISYVPPCTMLKHFPNLEKHYTRLISEM